MDANLWSEWTLVDLHQQAQVHLTNQVHMPRITQAPHPHQSLGHPHLLKHQTRTLTYLSHGSRSYIFIFISVLSQASTFYFHTGSISAPLTPPMSSQKVRSSPCEPHSEWFSGIPSMASTFSLVASNPFGFKEAVVSHGGSRMWTPGQSGTCSPAIPLEFDSNADIPMAEVVSDESVFGSNVGGRVKPSLAMGRRKDPRGFWV